MAALRDQLLEGRPLNVFHDQEVLAELFDEVVDRHGVGMSERGRSTRLAAKAFDRSQVVLIQRAQHLDGDLPLHPVIPGLENACHAAGGDMLAYFVSPGDQCAFKLCQYPTS